jgi:hypothetical protein
LAPVAVVVSFPGVAAVIEYAGAYRWFRVSRPELSGHVRVLSWLVDFDGGFGMVCDAYEEAL